MIFLLVSIAYPSLPKLVIGTQENFLVKLTLTEKIDTIMEFTVLQKVCNFF